MVKTVGAEIETTNLPLNTWENIKKPMGWTAVTDGSIRTQKSRCCPIKDVTILERGGERFGAEMVSPIIMCDEDMWRRFLPIFSLLEESGEVARANNSIHIHVGIKSWQNIVDGWNWLEEIDRLIFNVSAPNGLARGRFNDFIYYRPLISPQWALNKEGYFMPSIGQVENVSSLEDFKYVMGRYDSEPPKWYATRYCGINPVAYLKYNTLEFRHFNFTNNFLTFKAWMFLCVGIVACLENHSYKTNMEELIYLGAKECSYMEGISALLNSLNVCDIFGKIDIAPIGTHTNKHIYWSRDNEDISTEDSLLRPTIVENKVRKVLNVHPDNMLEEVPENNIVYLGEY